MTVRAARVASESIPAIAQPKVSRRVALAFSTILEGISEKVNSEIKDASCDEALGEDR
jgi:hypothetical protein